MLLIKFKEQIPIDRYTVYEMTNHFYAFSFFDRGGLRYFKLDRYNVKVIPINDIISMEEVLNND